MLSLAVYKTPKTNGYPVFILFLTIFTPHLFTQRPGGLYYAFTQLVRWFSTICLGGFALLIRPFTQLGVFTTKETVLYKL